MMRQIASSLLLSALAACTRTIPVDSLAPHVGRADRLRLSSGERVRVDRIVAQTADAVVVESGGTSRRILLDDVVEIEDRDRVRGFLEGGAVGVSAGGVVGLGTGIYLAATRDGGTDEDDLDEAICGLVAIYVGSAVALAGMIVLGAAGGGIGAARGHTDVFQRRLPITVAPTRDGVSALWTIEF